MTNVYKNYPYYKTVEYMILKYVHDYNELYKSVPLTQSDENTLSQLETEINRLAREYNADSRLEAINKRDDYYRRCEVIHRTESKYRVEFSYSVV